MALSNQLIIKPLVELRSDGIKDLADLHFEVFKGYPNTRIGAGYIRAFFRWFASYGSAVGLVAFDRDQLVGYVVGAPVGYQNQMNRDLFRAAAIGIASRPWLLVSQAMITVIWAKLKTMIGTQYVHNLRNIS